MKKALVLLGLALLFGGLSYCWFGALAASDAPAEFQVGAEGAGAARPNESPGASVFAAGSGAPVYDPIVIGPCSLLPYQEQEISSQLDGLLSAIGVDLGQQVTAKQLLGKLDDQQLRPQVELLKIRAASLTAERIAQAQYEEADSKVAFALKANAGGSKAVPVLEHRMYSYQRERFAQEVLKAREERAAAAKELEKAEALLALHELRSGLAGEVVKVYKRPGEAVKQAEPLFQIANVNKLRVEGLCKAQQAHLLRIGMSALLEPEIRGDQVTELVGHTGPISALAISQDGRLLASASDDRSVMLWSWPQGTRQALLPHPAEVTAVAVGGTAGGGYHVVTGCLDGRVRHWRIRAGNKIETPHTFAEGHQGSVRALAFLPGNLECVSGGEDKCIARWDLATGRHLGWIHSDNDTGRAAHQGAVTSLQATPDGCLVSAGRDNVVKVWKLHDGAAQLTATHRGRTGEAGQLGVHPNGSRVLFDHGDELRLLDRDGGHTVGVLRGRRQARFQAFGLFSPSGNLVLATANNGRLHLWKTPGTDAGRQGFEIRHYQPPSAAALQCAVFAPDEKVFFTGGADKVIRVWAAPSSQQCNQALVAKLTYVGSQVERGTDFVRVRAEIDNPAAPSERLRPGIYAALRIFPEVGDR